MKATVKRAIPGSSHKIGDVISATPFLLSAGYVTPIKEIRSKAIIKPIENTKLD